MTYTIADFRRDYRSGQWAWPGGYPKFFITSDGASLDFESVRTNRRAIIESIATDSRDGWHIVGCEVNWEDGELSCDHSGRKISSAYGEDS